MQHILQVKAALFFELDGVVRRLKPEVAKSYFDLHGMVPPAPVDVGEQELIPEVVAFIKAYMADQGVMAIALDQAPYVEDGVMPWESYLAIKDETLKLLREAGIEIKDFAMCPHAPRRDDVFDKAGTVVDKLVEPKCRCRFPNPELLDAMTEKYGLTHAKEGVHYRMLRPNVMIGNTQEAADVSVKKMGMEFYWAEGIINGKAFRKDQVTHAHLATAAKLKDMHQQLKNKYGDMMTSGGNENIHVDARDFPDMPTLPPEFDKPVAP